MSEEAKEETSNVTALRSANALGAGEALATKETYTSEAWWRWDAMIKGGAVAKTETPASCIAKAAFGEAYGWSPIVSVARVYLVEGRPCLAAEAMVGLVRERMPEAQIYKVEHDKTKCVIKAKRSPSDEHWHVVEARIEDFGHLKNKTNWKNYPRQMLWARAASMLTRELFSDVTLGAYTPGELEDAAVSRVRQVGPRSAPMPGEGKPAEPETVDADIIDDPAEESEAERCDLCGGTEDCHVHGCPDDPDTESNFEHPEDDS